MVGFAFFSSRVSLRLALYRLAKRSVASAFGHPESIQHPINRVSRYPEQFRRAMAIALRRLQCPNQRQLGGIANHSVERVGPLLLSVSVSLGLYGGHERSAFLERVFNRIFRHLR